MRESLRRSGDVIRMNYDKNCAFWAIQQGPGLGNLTRIKDNIAPKIVLFGNSDGSYETIMREIKNIR